MAQRDVHISVDAAEKEREDSSLLTTAAQSRTPWTRGVAFLLVGVTIGALLVSALGRGQLETPAAAAPMQATATLEVPGTCPLAACVSSGCDWASAPYLCLEGHAARGCSSEVATWQSVNGHCDSFCDLKGCDEVIKAAGSSSEGAESLPRSCGLCDEDQCAVLAAQWSQACGAGAPFVCLGGSAMWGCASSALAWAAAAETTCGECCDINGCWGP